MAGKKRKTAAQKKRAAKIKRRIFLLVLLFLTAFFVYLYANAQFVFVRYTDAKIKGLDAFHRDTKILFVSDLKIKDREDAVKSAKLLKKLLETEPDILIFGGDFTGMKLTDAFKIQSDEGKAEVTQRLREARRSFFIEISAFAPNVKKYAVSGEADSEIPGLYEDCMLGNVKLISNWIEPVALEGKILNLVGYGDYATGEGVGFKFRELTSGETVIVITHNPDAYPLIASVTENGNAIADLVLAGHTLGGQIHLPFGDLLGGYDGVYVSGIYNEAGPNMLVSNGVGTNWLPLRLGRSAEANLITLKSY